MSNYSITYNNSHSKVRLSDTFSQEEINSALSQIEVRIEDIANPNVKEIINVLLGCLGDIKEERQDLTESVDDKTVYARIARFKEFDNGYVHFDYTKMKLSDAEMMAKEASIEDPDDIYYVKFDSVMDPSSDYRWVNGEKYYYNQVKLIGDKPKITGEPIIDREGEATTNEAIVNEDNGLRIINLIKSALNTAAKNTPHVNSGKLFSSVGDVPAQGIIIPQDQYEAYIDQLIKIIKEKFPVLADGISRNSFAISYPDDAETYLDDHIFATDIEKVIKDDYKSSVDFISDYCFVWFMFGDIDDVVQELVNTDFSKAFE